MSGCLNCAFSFAPPPTLKNYSIHPSLPILTPSPSSPLLSPPSHPSFPPSSSLPPLPDSHGPPPPHPLARMGPHSPWHVAPPHSPRAFSLPPPVSFLALHSITLIFEDLHLHSLTTSHNSMASSLSSHPERSHLCSWAIMAPFTFNGLLINYSWLLRISHSVSSSGSSDRSSFTLVGSPLLFPPTSFFLSASASACLAPARLFYSRTSTPSCGRGLELLVLAQFAPPKTSESSFKHFEQIAGGWRSAQTHDIESFNRKIRGFVRIWQASSPNCSSKKSAITKNWR
jgi:hypothetical protein